MHFLNLVSLYFYSHSQYNEADYSLIWLCCHSLLYPL